MKDINLDKNKSFCVFPFIHISSIGNRVKPCCRFAPDKEIVQKYLRLKKRVFIGDIFMGKEYTQLRQKMLDGELVRGCYKCYREEENGGKSMRQGAYEDFKHLLSPKLIPEIKYLEIGFSNICNLKCRTCSSDLSTFWMDDEKKISGKYEDRTIKIVKNFNKNNFFKDKDLLKLQHVKFVGGEPMLNKEFPLFLKRLIDLGANKNCILELFTNVSYFPDKKIIESLYLFKGVRVHLSIDAYGDKNEYIRHPANWQIVDLDVSRWLKLRSDKSNISIQLETTVSIYNMLYLEDLLDWWIKKNDEIDNGEYRIHLIFAFFPKYISTTNLPTKVKNIVFANLEKLVIKYKEYEFIYFWIENILCTMRGGSKNKVTDFLRFTKELDSIRSESFETVFPELSELLTKNNK